MKMVYGRDDLPLISDSEKSSVTLSKPKVPTVKKVKKSV